MIDLPGDSSGRHAPRSAMLAWGEPAWPFQEALVVTIVVVLTIAAAVQAAARGGDRAGSTATPVPPASAARAPVRLAAPGEVAHVDADYLPLVTVAPVYPPAAQQQRLEGRCTVEYTIAATGAVRGVRARACEPAGVFEQAAIDAARQFKYRPRIRAGVPVPVSGVRNEFQFTLAQ